MARLRETGRLEKPSKVQPRLEKNRSEHLLPILYDSLKCRSRRGEIQGDELNFASVYLCQKSRNCKISERSLEPNEERLRAQS